ncbi:MAG: hypothetical protein IT192_07365 [Microbacteriaceae bacterium]|nr:hypothetical protein [Microbacteriaceae bacterium]
MAGCVTPGGDRTGPSPTATSFRDSFNYSDYLALLKQASGIENPPPTTMVRMISANELDTVWSDCMHEQGFDVLVTFDGGQSPPIDLPESQAEAYKLANYICYAKYPVDQSTYEFGEEQVKITYRYYVDSLVPCLESKGYQIDYVPSEAVFESSYGSNPWTPYSVVDISRLSDEAWKALNQACPQQPSYEVLHPKGK